MAQLSLPWGFPGAVACCFPAAATALGRARHSMANVKVHNTGRTGSIESNTEVDGDGEGWRTGRPGYHGTTIALRSASYRNEVGAVATLRTPGSKRCG
jgi:hypothetical protein